MKLFIYCRVSTDDQEDNTSLEQQEIDCVQYCQDNAITVVDVIREVFTGAVWRERKKFMEMRRRYLAGEADGVLVRTYSRFSRSLEDYFVLKQEMRMHNVELLCVKEQYDDTPMGRMLQAIQMGFNEQERAVTRQRIIDGKLARATNKKEYLAASKPPFGYRFDDPVKKAKLVVNAAEAEIVLWIFEERAYRGGTYLRIAINLNEWGIPSPMGKQWHQSAVKRIINNGKHLYRGIGVAFKSKDTQVYSGGTLKRVRSFNTEEEMVFLPEGTVERVIDDDLAFKALAMAEVNKQDNPRANKNPEYALLRGGFVVCGACGHPMTAISLTSRKYPYYMCGATNRADKACTTHISIHTHIIDGEVWNYALGMAKNIGLLREGITKVRGKDMLASAEASTLQCIQECEDMVGQYKEDLKDRSRKPAIRAVLLDELETQLELKAKFEGELGRIRAGRMDYNKVQMELEKLAAWCENVREGTDAPLSWEEKRSHLRLLGIHAHVYPEKDTTHERIEIHISPEGLIDALGGKLDATHRSASCRYQRCSCSI